MSSISRVALLSFCMFFLVGCAGITKEVRKPDARIVVVVVGGNSECWRDRGMWLLYEGRDRAPTEDLIRGLSSATKIPTEYFSTHYFSWTGDAEADTRCLPGRLDWIKNGSNAIADALDFLTNPYLPAVPVVVAGWSNGGATAYELACKLARDHHRTVDILLTLDPVSYTTPPCVSSEKSADHPRVAKNWLNVYTASGRFNRFRASNVIAAFGHAWDAEAPPRSNEIQGLHLPAPHLKARPADHGDTLCLWTAVVLRDEQFQRWAAQLGSGRGESVSGMPAERGCQERYGRPSLSPSR